MNVLLNSRVLIGEKHDAAAAFARHWDSDIARLVSPSNLCVLNITASPGETTPPASPFGSPTRSTLALVNRLEDDLRRHLGISLPK